MPSRSQQRSATISDTLTLLEVKPFPQDFLEHCPPQYRRTRRGVIAYLRHHFTNYTKLLRRVHANSLEHRVIQQYVNEVLEQKLDEWAEEYGFDLGQYLRKR